MSSGSDRRTAPELPDGVSLWTFAEFAFLAGRADGTMCERSLELIGIDPGYVHDDGVVAAGLSSLVARQRATAEGEGSAVRLGAAAAAVNTLLVADDVAAVYLYVPGDDDHLQPVSYLWNQVSGMLCEASRFGTYTVVLREERDDQSMLEGVLLQAARTMSPDATMLVGRPGPEPDLEPIALTAAADARDFDARWQWRGRSLTVPDVAARILGTVTG